MIIMYCRTDDRMGEVIYILYSFDFVYPKHATGVTYALPHTKRSRQWVRELRSRAAAIPFRLTGSEPSAYHCKPVSGSPSSQHRIRPWHR